MKLSMIGFSENLKVICFELDGAFTSQLVILRNIFNACSQRGYLFDLLGELFQVVAGLVVVVGGEEFVDHLGPHSLASGADRSLQVEQLGVDGGDVSGVIPHHVGDDCSVGEGEQLHPLE